MFTQADEKSVFYFAGNNVGAGAPGYFTAFGPQLVDCRIDQISVYSQDTQDNEVWVQVQDPGFSTYALFTVVIPAVPVGSTLSSVELFTAVGGGFGSGLVLPKGWSLLVQVTTTPLTGLLGMNGVGGTL